MNSLHQSRRAINASQVKNPHWQTAFALAKGISLNGIPTGGVCKGFQVSPKELHAALQNLPKSSDFTHPRAYLEAILQLAGHRPQQTTSNENFYLKLFNAASSKDIQTISELFTQAMRGDFGIDPFILRACLHADKVFQQSNYASRDPLLSPGQRSDFIRSLSDRGIQWRDLESITAKRTKDQAPTHTDKSMRGWRIGSSGTITGVNALACRVLAIHH